MKAPEMTSVYDRVNLIPMERRAHKHKHKRCERPEEEHDLSEMKPVMPSPSDDQDSTADSDEELRKKSVRWSTVTVYEFGVAIGGSAIPRHGGPSVGLARRPKSIWSATVDDVEYEPLSDEDDAWLQNLPDRTKQQPSKVVRTPVARRRRVRWLKPLERVQLLTKAGCSEKRIYRMMMESSEIAMSRRLCVSVQRDIPV